MTKPKAKQKGVDPALVKAIKDMMAEVTAKPPEGEKPAYSLTEKCRVLDRMIKIESMRLGVQEDDGGSFFKHKEEDDEPE